MNNEEKILSTLDSLMFAVNSLAVGQTKLETTIDEIKTQVEDIHNNLALLENENKQAHGGLFDGLSLLQDTTDRIRTDVAILTTVQGAHELHIKRLDDARRKTV